MNINNKINEVKLKLLKCGAIHAEAYNKLVYEYEFRNYEGNMLSRKLFMEEFFAKYNDINKSFIHNVNTAFNEIPDLIGGPKPVEEGGGKKTMKKRIKNNKNKTRKGKQ